MDWATIIAAIIAAIQECRKNRSEEQIFQDIRDGGAGVRWTLRRIGREKGLDGRELRAFVNESMADLEDVQDSEISGWIAQSKQ